MKRLANYAMKEFEKDVKNGHQKALTNEEKSTFILDASNVPLPPTKAERIRGVPPSRVRQSKILRQADRVDPLTGLGRSKGYGFLELGCHADALRVLRWANANKDVGALFRMWWREALEGYDSFRVGVRAKLIRYVVQDDRKGRDGRRRSRQGRYGQGQGGAAQKAQGEDVGAC